MLLVLLAGCASSSSIPGDFTESEREELEQGREKEGEMEMGPPPPGYWRIVGDAVPGWQPRDMHKPTDGPGIWTMIGPRPMTNEYWSGTANAGGRTVGIAVDPTNASIVYAATASGGVWKTVNAGTTWTPMTDELSILTHGAITIDPSNHNTIYAGTGEYTQNSGGDGLFRSTDAGVNWTRIGTTAQVGVTCSRIYVDPTNPLVIHATGSIGYVRSTDGGASWSTRLAGARCSDMALNATSPQTLYVARHGDGIYRSTDGGTTLTKLTNGLPTTGLNRIILVISKSNPSILYTSIINSSSGLLGAYKTIDGGDTWTQLVNTPNFPSPQGSYDCCMAVDPVNPDICYAGGVFPSYAVAGVIKTTNGGASWTDISVPPGGGQVHPDQQTMAFGPDGTLWVGNDGGVWKSTTAGNSWINCNSTLGATQHYQVALHPTDQSRVIGGTQDNGTAARDLGTDAWPQILSGDGGFCCYDRTTPTRRYVTYVYLAVYRISGGTTNISGPWSSDTVNFIAPLVMDPNVSTTLLGGTNRVWRTTNASNTAALPTWTAISTTSVAAGGTLNAIAVAKGASNTIYTGSSTGKVYATTDAAIWNDRSVGLPASSIADVIVSPTAPATLYVSNNATSAGRVFRSDNSGTTWTDKTGTLPAGVRAKALEIDWRFNPPVMYVGTGAGMYWSFNDGITWTKDGADFPNVNVGDIQIDRVNNTVTVGTYGRGVWRANLLTPPAACYANCDNSTSSPVLTANDFQCFLNSYASGQSYANCDGSTSVPILTANDFQCFLNAYAAGCS